MIPSTLYCTNCGAANQSQAAYCFACGQSLQTPGAVSNLHVQTGLLEPDEVLKQRYRIIDLIGKGGFGAVYKAADIQLGDRPVAVKEMSQSVLKPQEIGEAVSAFKHEALLLAGLIHENLPRIYDHFSEGGRWYLVMDFIEGGTLEAYLDKTPGGRLSLEEALDIALQLCNVLDYLHTRQPPIIFRDLKPANIILTPKGHIFLIDFGIARHFKPGQTRDTIAFGSPGYAPPEQYGKAQTTPRADIYSLGAMLHQLITGDDPSLTPFRFAPLRIHAPALQQLLTRMLELDEAKRPASMAEVEDALQQIADAPAADLVSSSNPGAAKVITPLAHHLVVSPTPASTTLLIYRNYNGPVKCVAWSPDGTRIASADSATVQVWDASTGNEICLYENYVGEGKALAWSPDGRRIACGCKDGYIHIWDAATGHTLIVSPGRGPVSRANTLSWSPDGTRIASTQHTQSVHIWSATTGQKRGTLRKLGLTGTNTALAWAPDSPNIAVAVKKNVYIWNVPTGKRSLAYEHESDIKAMVWSPDGKWIASAAFDTAIHVWNATDSNRLCTFMGHRSWTTSLAWSPDSKRIASGGFDETVRIWDITTGQNVFVYRDQATWIHAVDWSSDGSRIASGGYNATVQVWKAPG